MQLALQSPDLIRSVVLLEAGPLMQAPSSPALVEGLKTLEQMHRVGQGASVIEAFLATLNGAVRRPDLDRIFSPGWEAAARCALDTYFDVDVPAALEWVFGETEASRLELPILSIVGGDSLPAFKESHDLLPHWLTQARGTVLEGLPHGLQWFDPEVSRL